MDYISLNTAVLHCTKSLLKEIYIYIYNIHTLMGEKSENIHALGFELHSLKN